MVKICADPTIQAIRRDDNGLRVVELALVVDSTQARAASAALIVKIGVDTSRPRRSCSSTTRRISVVQVDEPALRELLPLKSLCSGDSSFR